METPIAILTIPEIAPLEVRPLLAGRQRRTCLCCGKQFNSMNIGNRVCPACKTRNARCGRLKGLLAR